MPAAATGRRLWAARQHAAVEAKVGLVRVCIVTLGTLGDVLPLCALGAGLTRAGHRVRVATHVHYRPYVLGHGLEYASMPLDPVELFSGAGGTSWLASRNNPLRFMAGLARVARPAIPRLTQAARAACSDADAVVFTTLGMMAHHIGERLGIPTFLASLQPIMPTSRFPSVLAPARVRLGAWLQPHEPSGHRTGVLAAVATPVQPHAP